MDVKAIRRIERFGGTTCVYWLAGKCNRNPCRFLHRETPSPAIDHYNGNTAYRYVRKPHSSAKKAPKYNSEIRKSGADGTSLAKASQKSSPHSPVEKFPKYNSEVRKSGADGTSLVKASQKSSQSICRCWVNDNCVQGDQCKDLHSWSYGDGFSMLAKLEGHKKVITGIALPVESDKLYSGSIDGTVRLWDCHTGCCTNVINLGAAVTSLISEGPWIFVGLRNAVKAWNIHTSSEFTLDGPKGRVLAMIVGNDTLFAAAEDGSICAWRGSSETESPFELVASLSGHTNAVVCLTVGRKMLYSGSVDHSIKVWDMDTLQCKMTLNGHAGVVTSLICWDNYLLSSSSDCTIKVWAAIEGGTLEVIYTHTEENGVLALSGMTVAESKHILFCSCTDNSVRLYELPSFSERGRLFAKQEVRSIAIGPSGLFFTGDGTGFLMVWKWLEVPRVASS